jgi:hypothetical protein
LSQLTAQDQPGKKTSPTLALVKVVTVDRESVIARVAADSFGSTFAYLAASRQLLLELGRGLGGSLTDGEQQELTRQLQLRHSAVTLTGSQHPSSFHLSDRKLQSLNDWHFSNVSDFYDSLHMLYGIVEDDKGTICSAKTCGRMGYAPASSTYQPTHFTTIIWLNLPANRPHRSHLPPELAERLPEFARGLCSAGPLAGDTDGGGGGGGGGTPRGKTLPATVSAAKFMEHTRLFLEGALHASGFLDAEMPHERGTSSDWGLVRGGAASQAAQAAQAAQASQASQKRGKGQGQTGHSGQKGQTGQKGRERFCSPAARAPTGLQALRAMYSVQPPTPNLPPPTSHQLSCSPLSPAPTAPLPPPAPPPPPPRRPPRRRRYALMYCGFAHLLTAHAALFRR